MTKRTMAVFIEVDGDDVVEAIQADSTHITQALKSFMVTAARKGTKKDHGEIYASVKVKDTFSVYDKATGAWT